MTRPVDVVREVAPIAKPSYLGAFENGDALLQKHEITTPNRLAHFLAQVLHESGGLRHEWEGMNYRADRLLEIFGTGRHSAKITPEEASRIAGNPEAIAERVYGLGNSAKAAELGNSHSGDGFRYRGGGLMQTTGRFNYRSIGEKCGVDFEGQPELVVAPEHALKPALAVWTQHRLNALADADDILAISRAINLGNPRSTRTPNGLADRKEHLKKVRSLIGNAVTFNGSATAPGAVPAAVADATSGRTMDLREVQRRLKAMELYTDEVDGQYGPATETAITALFLNQAVSDFQDWPALRKIIGAGQLFCRIDGIDVGAIDGLMGPQTREAFEIYAARDLNNGNAVGGVEHWRDEQPGHSINGSANGSVNGSANGAVNGSVAAHPASALPQPASTAPTWPREAQVASFFGAPGSNQTTLILPFPMRLAWDLGKTVSKTSCNVKVHDSLKKIWQRTLDHYGLDDIRRLRLDLFGGCLNVRRKRGGSGWSMHAYGIAWDVDPDHNALRMGRDDATLDGPEYDAFWGFVYDEGAISLGKERNFDWMHFQFARI